MIDFHVTLFPLIALSAINFFLSWLWYSPLLFAKPWMKALGKEGNETTEAERRGMPWLLLSGVCSSVLTVYGLMVIVHTFKADTFAKGMLAGAVIWAGFAVTHSLNTLWEGRRPLVLAINNGLFLLTYVIFGGTLAIWA